MIILTVEHISSLIEKVNTLSQKLDNALSGHSTPIAYSNQALANLFGVSLRTLQNWRNTGKIRYVKVDRIILYRHEDVATMLYEHISGVFQFDTARRRRKTIGHPKTSAHGK